MNNIHSFKAYAWLCDSSPFRGEGILGIKFLSMLLKKKVFKKIEVQNPHIQTSYDKVILQKNNNEKKKIINHSFFYKYITPFIGLYNIWAQHMLGKQTIYVNFLPLWNFFLFLFLPKKTILGPVTGSIYKGKVINIDTFLRKYLINLFYLISIQIIKLKYKNILFSTENLKEILPKKFQNRFFFNFQFYDIQFYKSKKKDIDILFYYRNHQNKFSINIIKILHKLKSKKYKILIVGDKLRGFKNIGIINRIKLLEYLKRTRFTFLSIENTYSFFSLDAISCNVRIIDIYDKKIKIFSNFFIKENLFNKETKYKHKILPKKAKYDYKTLQFLKKLNNLINNYIKKFK